MVISVSATIGVPAVGSWVTEATPQLSEAVTAEAKSGTRAVQPPPKYTVSSSAQVVIDGLIASCTVTVALHEAALSAASRTVSVTVFSPRSAQLKAL